MDTLIIFFLTLYKQRSTIGQLIMRDFKNKYLASYLGLPWAFIKQGTVILVIWFAFTYGLKIGDTDSGPSFMPWLICGLIPWLFISDALESSSSSLIEYSYLIKETSFKVAIIPLIKIFTAFIIHLVFIAFIAFIAMLYGYYPNIYWLQIFYFIVALFILLTGVSWLISSINVFIRDMDPLVNIVLSILFWVTPIVWPYSVLSGNLKYIALLNPFFYIIEGYRYTFLGKAWMHQNIEMTIFFWISTIIIFIVGALVFKKLSPRFIDVI